ncbi:MAG: hypothetical protein ACRC7N_06000 [Clostridium sp.]
MGIVNGCYGEDVNELKKSSEIGKYKDNFRISNFFEGEEYYSIIRLFRERNLEYIWQITDEIVVELCMSRGFGIKRINALKNRLIDIYINERHNVKINYDIFSVNFWFSNAPYHYIREYFVEENNIHSVIDITFEDLRTFSIKRKISSKKLEGIIRDIEECKGNINF